MKYFQNISNLWGNVLTALGNTVYISLIAIVLGTILGIAMGVVLTYCKKRWQWLFRIYVDIVRGLPVLVTIFVVYYFVNAVLKMFFGFQMQQNTAGAVALTMFSAAQMTELTRGALQAIPKGQIEAGRAILAGDADIIVCGGTENMSAAPYASTDARWGARMGDKKLVDTMIKDGLWDAFNNYHMGTTAENVCDVWGITREELDAFGAASQQKTEAAQASGRFDAEIVPVPVKVKKEIVEFKKDEFPRAGSTPEGLAKLKGAFPVGPEGVEDQVVHTFQPTEIHEADTRKHVQRVTAGNASGINDGAAAIVLASGEAVKKYNLKPMAKLIGWGQGGVDPKIMGVGPVPASRQAMAKAGVTIDDIDLVEANEAFAAQSIAVARELHFDMSKVNVNGGAIALGHPVGASGARIIVTLIHEMMKRPEAKKGLATLCIGGGQGVATVFEKC